MRLSRAEAVALGVDLRELVKNGNATPGIQPKKSKYGNKKTIVDGIRFDSKREADRYVDLIRLQSAGQIDRLERQVRYDFQINGVKLGFYKADFRYLKMDRGYASEYVVEDVKGMLTPVYRLKKKLMKAIYGIEVLET